ncbi:Uncharacterised protein [BD1-7 clade bacterium]|uniref:HTH luxR-type domain-containing protein n=1 Tax=BD1-7 clade bacterium TaxID=2029982 RepID=A0A5S9QIW2_9GAMM|nr:Uncharacterised protein [BD1-7 clade bacterium]CAA0117655.1 Uncharacterised protein [BD1-7 clade bacterium]
MHIDDASKMLTDINQSLSLVPNSTVNWSALLSTICTYTGAQSAKRVRINPSASITPSDDTTRVWRLNNDGAALLLKFSHPETCLSADDLWQDFGAPIRAIFQLGVAWDLRLHCSEVQLLNDHQLLAEMLNIQLSEAKIAAAFCTGNSAKTIASDTGYTLHTVYSYIKKLYKQLNIHSQSQLTIALWRYIPE